MYYHIYIHFTYHSFFLNRNISSSSSSSFFLSFFFLKKKNQSSSLIREKVAQKKHKAENTMDIHPPKGSFRKDNASFASLCATSFVSRGICSTLHYTKFLNFNFASLIIEP